MENPPIARQPPKVMCAAAPKGAAYIFTAHVSGHRKLPRHSGQSH